MSQTTTPDPRPYWIARWVCKQPAIAGHSDPMTYQEAVNEAIRVRKDYPNAHVSVDFKEPSPDPPICEWCGKVYSPVCARCNNT